MLVILNILLVPILLFAIEGVQHGSFYFLIAYIGVNGINLGYYIYALVVYLVNRKHYKGMKKSLTLAETFMVPKEYLQ